MNIPIPSQPRPLEGQRALVTGADSGIGAAVAEGLAEAGAKVVVNYGGSRDRAEALVARIRGRGGEAIAVAADVSREEPVKALFGAAAEAFGGVDILVKYAGLRKDAPIAAMPLADWERVIGANLTGPFLCAREAAREFIRRGVVPEISAAAGKIICLSSIRDRLPWTGHANAAASGGGVMMLVKALAQELAPHRIRVNRIAPGAIRTGIDDDAWMTPERETDLLRLIPYGRIGECRDIAGAAVWLASDASDYVTGATLYVDGGMALASGFESGGSCPAAAGSIPP